MIKEILVKENTFENKILLFKKLSSLTRLNLLFGGNGVGKSTLLNAIKNETVNIVSSKKYKTLNYINSKDNFQHKVPDVYKPKGFVYDAVKHIKSQELSEGQSIINSILYFFNLVSKTAQQLENESLIVLIDELDSGLSVENINMCCHWIIDTLQKNENIQIFMSFNNYHFAYVFKDVINMYVGKKDTIESYEDFFKKLSDNMVELGKKRNLEFLI